HVTGVQTCALPISTLVGDTIGKENAPSMANVEGVPDRISRVREESEKMSEKKIWLPESEIPTHWYNMLADMPNPIQPPLNPQTGKPASPEDFAAIFPQALIEQEMSTERWIEIPEEVRELYKIWRPSPLIRATGLEKLLDTPAHIYYKYEGVSPAGSHKLNTAIPQ